MHICLGSGMCLDSRLIAGASGPVPKQELTKIRGTPDKLAPTSLFWQFLSITEVDRKIKMKKQAILQCISSMRAI